MKAKKIGWRQGGAALAAGIGFALAIGWAAAGAQRAPSKVAVLVGIEKYSTGRGFEPLRYTVDDAEKLGAVLKRYGFTVITLTDADATKADIVDRLAQLPSAFELEGIGTVLFFFSGHGFSIGNEHYLAVYDVRGADLASSALKVRDVEAALARTGALQRMIWIDACRSVANRGPEEQRTFSRIMLGEGTALLLSTRYGEVSRELPELGNGVFTHFLVRGLSGEASRGPVRFLQLADWLIEQMRVWTLQKGILQVPYVAGENANILIGTLDGSVAAEPPPTVPPAKTTADSVSSTAPVAIRAVNPEDITLAGPFDLLLEKSTAIRDQKFLQFSDFESMMGYFQDDPYWKKGEYSITSVGAGNDGIFVVLSSLGNPSQFYFYAGDFPQDEVKKKWDEGFRISEIGVVPERWFVMMSKGIGLGGQSYKISETWPEEYIKKEWDLGRRISHARRRDGKFVVVMSEFQTRKIKAQRWRKGWDDAWVQEGRDKDQVISLIAPDKDSTYFVMSEYEGAYDGYRVRDSERFPAAELAKKIAEGYWVTFVY
jgi:hypothetical protein